MLLPIHPPALLALADGTIFNGYSIGAEGFITGEVVFNTAITGYQEILTDPSYASQIVTLTYPHIGNVGVNSEDIESYKIFAAGLIIRDLPILASNFRQKHSLSEYLINNNIVAIAGIDTRRLTRLLRQKGAQNACLLSGQKAKKNNSNEEAVALARSFSGLKGQDLAQVVSTKKAYEWTETEWCLESGYGKKINPKHHIVAFDYGVKFNILRMLAERECRVTVLPAKTPIEEALALKPDGVFLSNGPGDPEPCDYAIDAVKALIKKEIPTFGICLGHQIMALAVGAKTYKMKNGHHGANHPVQDIETKQVFITSQNHSFAVDEKTLPANTKITHVSLFDGTLQGFALKDKPFFCFQGHPEASPGPSDIGYLFDRFIDGLSRNAP